MNRIALTLPIRVVSYFCFTFLASCNLSQEIEVDLTDFEGGPVVECYLYDGEPYRLSLQRSAGYFDELQLPVESGATVVITHRGVADTLEENFLFVDSIERGYNYRSSTLAVADDAPYELYVRTQAGEVLIGMARFLPPVPIDTVEYRFNNDGDEAFVLTKFTDDPETDNFYRYTLNKGDIKEVVTDFSLDDRLFENERAALGSGFDFAPGDTAIVTLTHLEEEYYTYLETVDAAFNSNTNPLAQPALVESTVNGGIGAFAAISFARDTVFIPLE